MCVKSPAKSLTPPSIVQWLPSDSQHPIYLTVFPSAHSLYPGHSPQQRLVPHGLQRELGPGRCGGVEGKPQRGGGLRAPRLPLQPLPLWPPVLPSVGGLWMQVCSLLVCWDGGDRTLNVGPFIASVLGWGDRTLNAGPFIASVLGWGWQDCECRSIHCYNASVLAWGWQDFEHVSIHC